MTWKKLSSIALALLTTSLMLSIGCVGLPSFPAKGSISKKMPWSKKDDIPKPYPNPARMAATWTPDTLVQTGRTPTRGFGGRIFFYDEKTKAVAVDGDLTVHAFAEGANGEQGEVKRYHFTAEQFTKHFSQSDLGASYSVWIPWDAVGGDQMRVSLVPSFRTASGKLVQGDQALVGLPGKRHTEEKLAERPTAAEILAETRDSSKSGLVTTTIPVRSALRREMTPSPQPMFQPPTEAIVSNSNQPTSMSFDVAPLGIKPSVKNQLSSRPLRLGQANPATRGVIHASANLPLE